jgi:N-acetyl-gamma-glutamylphosphate reductase
LIKSEDIIIDAKSGVSGAGRSGKVNLLYTEIAEGINSYGVGSHRHMPEIEQVILTTHRLNSSNGATVLIIIILLVMITL